MNPIIASYFDEIELRLIESRVVASYEQVSREVTLTGGKLRLRATLVNGSLLELFEYVVEEEGRIALRKYSFHWQDASGELICRWDNVKHYPNLPNAPHHFHPKEGSPQPVFDVPDSLTVLAKIEERLGSG
ncbi:MAG: toxin-antitoxin system TumE family protein [Anaerolineae bacterium]